MTKLFLKDGTFHLDRDDEIIAGNLRKNQEAIANFNNKQYQKMQKEKAQREAQFRSVFGKYLNRKREKGG